MQWVRYAPSGARQGARVGTRRRRLRFAAAWAAAALMGASLAGCSSHSSGGAAAKPPAAAWEQITSQVQPDGTVSLATALDGFALAVGPLPGVTPPSGAAETIPSGTLAVAWVLGKWNQLSAAQQAAVRSDLGAGAASGTPASATASAADAVRSGHAVGGANPAGAVELAAAPPNPQLPCATTDSAGAAPYVAQLPGIEAQLGSHLGHTLTLAVHIEVNSQQLEGQSFMYTWPCAGAKAAGDTVTGCTIHINPGALGAGYTDSDRTAFLIHEMAHCYLFSEFGVAYAQMPAWYLEGAPTWIMTALGGGDPASSKYWVAYLDSATEPLFQRAYDAVGFYAQLEQSGTDVWKSINAIGAAFAASGDSNSAGWNAAGATQDFLDSWGSGYATGRYPGAAWDASGPNLPHYTDAVPQGSLGNSATLTLSAKPAAAAIEQVDVDAQVVQFTPGGSSSGRISLDGGADAVLSAAAGVEYCTLGGSACTCPADSAGAADTFTPLASGEHYVTVTGGLAAGSVTATGMTLADACKHAPPKPCVVGSWTGTGLSASGALDTTSGGSGAKLTIGADGAFTMDFDSMAPVGFTESQSSEDITGSFKYGGAESGTLILPAAGVSSSVMQIKAGTLDYGSLTETVDISSPVHLTLGPLSPSELLSEFGGSTSGTDEVPGNDETWQCQGNALTILVEPGAAVHAQWSFVRS